MTDPKNPDPLTKRTGYVEFKIWKISFKTIKYWWVFFLGGVILWFVIHHVIF